MSFYGTLGPFIIKQNKCLKLRVIPIICITDICLHIIVIMWFVHCTYIMFYGFGIKPMEQQHDGGNKERLILRGDRIMYKGQLVLLKKPKNN